MTIIVPILATLFALALAGDIVQLINKTQR